MRLTIELFEKRCATDEHLVVIVVMTWDFSRKVTVCEPYFELIRILESGTHDLNHGVALARSAFGIDFIDSDWRVEKTAIRACKQVCKDTLVCACILLS